MIHRSVPAVLRILVSLVCFFEGRAMNKKIDDIYVLAE